MKPAPGWVNEHDPFAANWIRNLSAAGLIPPCDVDERSIRDVQAADLVGRGTVHLFGGIGGWPLALQLAGWPDDRPVWTGSCPCQPYSSAGKGQGDADPRNLWPEMYRLVRECRPPVVFGEQVASAIGHGWLDGVFADLESQGYACGAVVLTAAGVGAPHIRQRLFWVADLPSDGPQRGGQSTGANSGRAGERCRRQRPADDGGTGGGLADAEGARLHQQQGVGSVAGGEGQQRERQPADSGGTSRLADANGGQPRHGGLQPGREHGQQPEDGGAAVGMGDANGSSEGPVGGVLGGAGVEREGGPWSDCRIIRCRDGKARRVPAEPALFPLAHGVPGRVGILRGAGNAIVPQVAAAFVRAFMEARS